MRAALVVLSLLVVAVACGPTGPTPAERAQAVQAARNEVAQPAGALGTVAEAVVAAVTEVRLGGLVDLADWRSNIEAVREGPLAQLESAVADVEAVELSDREDIEEVVAARQHWQDVQARSADLLANARAVITELERVLAWDEQLYALAATWESSGSRRTQLQRFTETAEAADELALDIAADTPTLCPDQLQRRVDAAEFIAASTRELRELIASYRGEAFDRRRTELAADPTGLGRPLAQLDGEDGDCIRERAGLETQPILDALAQLQAALNPPDL